MESSIYYFNSPGKHNTPEVLQAVRRRLNKRDIHHIVVASSSGDTALQLWDEIKSYEQNIVAVSLHAGFKGGDQVSLSSQTQQQLKEKDISVFIGSHSLSGVGRSFSKAFGGTTPPEVMAETLRLFGGHGIKVGVEVTIMAADAGLIPTDQYVIAIGGTHGGADSAMVLKPAHMSNLFEMEISEILCKPLKGEE